MIFPNIDDLNITLHYLSYQEEIVLAMEFYIIHIDTQSNERNRWIYSRNL